MKPTVGEHRPVSVRFAEYADLDLLAAIEDDADRLLIDRFSPAVWGAPMAGAVLERYGRRVRMTASVGVRGPR